MTTFSDRYVDGNYRTYAIYQTFPIARRFTVHPTGHFLYQPSDL
jgi:hypothetical protein